MSNAPPSSTINSTASHRLRSITYTLSAASNPTTTTMASQKLWAVVAGVGPGTGASVARRFAQSYNVLLLARNPDNYNSLVSEINDAGSKAIGISTDCSDANSVSAAFEKIRGEEGFQGNLAAAVYNVGGKFIRKSFLELTEDEFELGWKTNG